MLPFCVKAQEGDIVRRGCLPEPTGDGSALTRGGQRKLPAIKTNWDPQRIYRQAVILVAFADRDFTLENPRELYGRIFNEPGYNIGAGAGCVADYFREQSGGLFNVEFDIYGPVKVSKNAKENGDYGGPTFHDAAQKAIDSLAVDFSPYDWNNDGRVEQVIFIYAGYGGNQSAEAADSCIWPNTSMFSAVNTPQGKSIYNYTCSAELWTHNKSCGIGTICHEFSHSLGLPDLYPTVETSGFSVVDEWDLMDGGNFINSGWCPPNYSGLERMLLGWQTPIELMESTTITDMKPLSEGGPVYMIKHTDSEYYLLENRQWTGWDARVPGKGLVVFHVDFSSSAWSGNRVNNKVNQRGYQLVHADGLDYDAWKDIIGKANPYVNGHSRLLSTSPYPWTTDSTDFVNDCLTDTSAPPSLMFNGNAAGSKFLSKAITNIRVSEDGLVSFDFMGGDPNMVDDRRWLNANSEQIIAIYDLSGLQVTSQRPGRIYIVRYADGKTKKVVKH